MNKNTEKAKKEELKKNEEKNEVKKIMTCRMCG